MDDVLTELERFAFGPVEEGSSAQHAGSRDTAGYDWPTSADPADRWAPASNPMRDVGRNDPCPCGSGKKYKKCCGAAA